MSRVRGGGDLSGSAGMRAGSSEGQVVAVVWVLARRVRSGGRDLQHGWCLAPHSEAMPVGAAVTHVTQRETISHFAVPIRVQALLHREFEVIAIRHEDGASPAAGWLVAYYRDNRFAPPGVTDTDVTSVTLLRPCGDFGPGRCPPPRDSECSAPRDRHVKTLPRESGPPAREVTGR